MAAVGSTRDSIERAMERLQKAFQDEKCARIPQNLHHLLTYPKEVKDTEETQLTHKQLYRQIYGILWFGSQKKIGHGCGSHPTYIYHQEVKGVARVRFWHCLKQWKDPEGPQVYHVTYSDLSMAQSPTSVKK